MEQQTFSERDSLGFLANHFSGYEPFTLSNGATVQVPKYFLTFKEWRGQKLQHTFGGKRVVDVSGSPQFVELAIADLFKRQGFSVRWIETYGRSSGLPMFLLDWKDMPYKDQDDHPIGDGWVKDALAGVASLNGNTYSGCWDVIAWGGGRLYFIESKRRGRDKLRESQRRWLDVGLSAGLPLESFIIIEWS